MKKIIYLSLILLGNTCLYAQSDSSFKSELIKMYKSKMLNQVDAEGDKLVDISINNDGLIVLTYESDPNKKKPRYFWMTKKSHIYSMSDQSKRLFKKNKINHKYVYHYKGQEVGSYNILVSDL